MNHNPYDILGVPQAASKAEIIKAKAVAMKRKQYPMEVIAKAEKSLLKSEERIIADCLHPILPTIKRFKHSRRGFRWSEKILRPTEVITSKPN